MRARRALFLTVLAAAGTVVPAQAEWLVTPYIGANFGDVEFRRGGPGLSIGYLGPRLGFEVDLDRHHHFFKDAEVASINPDPRIDLNTDAASFMANVMIPLRPAGTGRFRPYAIAGAGAVHAWFEFSAGGAFVTPEGATGAPLEEPADRDQTNPAVNVGGGALYRLSDRVGIRTDLRYFHAFVDEANREGGYFRDYDFARFSLGVTVRIGR